MSLAQDRLVLAAILLSESVWVYAVLGMVGLAFGGGGSPLGWLAVLAILTSSLLVARALQLVIMPTSVAYAIEMMAGAIVIYLTVGTQVTPGVQGLDIGWVGKLVPGSQAQGYLKVALGSLCGVGMWWRGGRLMASDYPVGSLEASFRLGVMALAVAAVVDMFHSADLHVFPLMFLFYAAGLAGLSVGHLLPASEQATEARAWTRVIGAVVAAVVVVGLLFSLLQRNVLSVVSAPALVVLNFLAMVFFFVVIVPIGLLVDLLVRAMRALLSRLVGANESQQLINPSEGFLEQLRRLQEGTGDRGASALLHVLEWTVLAVVALVVLFLLARAFRRRVRWRKVEPEGTRESVREGADPAADLAQLLFGLIPQRFKGGNRRRAFALPQDDPDVVDVFRVYFGLLVLAEERGFPRPASETPAEYQRTLETIFPQSLARAATAAFNRACYGHHPATRAQIEEMRVALEELA